MGNSAIPTVILAWCLTTCSVVGEMLKDLIAPPLVSMCEGLMDAFPSTLQSVQRHLQVETIVDKVLEPILRTLMQKKLESALDDATHRMQSLLRQPEVLA